MNETKVLSEFVATTKRRDIPTEVQHRIKQSILDQLGCEISGSKLPWNLIVYRAITELSGAGPAPVVVFGDRLAIDEAAFVNSAFGHGGDFDEATLRTHPSTVVVPAAFAIAALDADVVGSTLLSAITIGCEVMLRVTDAAGYSLKDERGHNTASANGPFGAAAAASRVLKQDALRSEYSLSIAGYHSAGLMQHAVHLGSARRLQTAIGSKSGVRAAWLAEKGVTGPAEILEGSRGFLQAFSNDFDAAKLVDGLGTRFLALHPTLKRFSVKFHIHSTIDGLVTLMGEHQLAYDDIAAIRVGVSESTRAAYGVTYRPSEAADQSAATQAAQFSIRYAMAAVARYGPAVLSDLGPAQFDDPQILGLAERIEVYREPDQEVEPWMSWGSVVSIVTAGGETHTIKVAMPVGSPENPMQDADVEEKFLRLAAPVLGDAKAAAILSAIWHLEEIIPSKELFPHLVKATA